MTTDFIRSAARRWQESDYQPEQRTAELTPVAASQVVGQPVSMIRLWKSNWRNRIYRLRLADGSEAVAKQSCVGNADEISTEYRFLVELHETKIPSLRIPQPRGYSHKLKTYAMDRCTGTPIGRAMREGRNHQRGAFELAGRVLRELHERWTEAWVTFPADELMDDFLAAPWELDRTQQQQLVSQVSELRGIRVAVGQPYLDFKLSNVCYDGQHLELIDPPEACLSRGILAWDLAVFRQSLCSELIARSYGSRRSLAARFVHAYWDAASRDHDQSDRSTFLQLVQLLELQRCFQLIALQRGRLAVAERGTGGMSIGRWAARCRALGASLWLRHHANRMLI